MQHHTSKWMQHPSKLGVVAGQVSEAKFCGMWKTNKSMQLTVREDISGSRMQNCRSIQHSIRLSYHKKEDWCVYVFVDKVKKELRQREKKEEDLLLRVSLILFLFGIRVFPFKGQPHLFSHVRKVSLGPAMVHTQIDQTLTIVQNLIPTHLNSPTYYLTDQPH